MRRAAPTTASLSSRAVIAALRAARIILPGAVVIERIAIAGRARVLASGRPMLWWPGLSSEHLTKLDGLLVVDPVRGRDRPSPGSNPCRSRPRRDHIRELLDRLKLVRGIGVPAESGGHVHEGRLQQFVREGHASDAHQLWPLFRTPPARNPGGHRARSRSAAHGRGAGYG